MVLIYGLKYYGHGNIVIILAISSFFLALATPLGYALRTIERTDVNFKCNLLQFGITITIGIWLIKMYASLGVASGILIGSIMTYVLSYYYYIVCSNAIAKKETINIKSSSC